MVQGGTSCVYRQPGLAAEALKRLVPDQVEVLTKDLDDISLEHILCRMLGVERSAFLPTETHVMPNTVDALLAALSQHFQEQGHPEVTAEIIQILRKGWYEVNDKKITCTSDPKAEKTEVKFDSADSVALLNPLDLNTGVKLLIDGRTILVGSVAAEFAANGVTLPKGEPAWVGSLFATKKVEEKNKKEKRKQCGDKPDEAVTPTSAFASKGSVMLSEALRKKLNMGTESKSQSHTGASSSSTPGSANTDAAKSKS